jgi:hypothetical protein
MYVLLEYTQNGWVLHSMGYETQSDIEEYIEKICSMYNRQKDEFMIAKQVR